MYFYPFNILLLHSVNKYLFGKACGKIKSGKRKSTIRSWQIAGNGTNQYYAIKENWIAIYSSDYLRTTETVKPLAIILHKEIELYKTDSTSLILLSNKLSASKGKKLSGGWTFKHTSAHD